MTDKDYLEMSSKLPLAVQDDLLRLSYGAKARLHRDAPELCIKRGRSFELTGRGYILRSMLLQQKATA